MERIAWAAAIAAAITWGATGTKPRNSLAKQASPEDRRREASRPTGRERHIDRTNRTERDTGDPLPSRARTLQALRNTDPLQRTSGFLRSLASCDARGLEEIANAFKELKTEGISLPEEEAWLHFRVGQLDGASLLQGKSGSPEDMSNLPELSKNFEGWVDADPYSATQWLKTLPSGRFRDRMAVIHIAASAKDDPTSVMKGISALHPSQRATAGQEVAQRLAESLSPAETSSLLESMVSGSAGDPGETYLAGLFDSIVARSVDGDEHTAIALVESHLGQPYASEKAIARIPSALAGRDPIRAIEWASEMEARQNAGAGTLVSAAIRNMTLEGLAETERWLATRTDQPDNETLRSDIDRQKGLLEDRGVSRNGYDSGD